MQLAQLLVGLVSENIPAVEITGVTLDSREVQPGTLFCAVLGSTVDGRDYISAAVTAGAVAVVYEKTAAWQPPPNLAIPCIAVTELKRYLGVIAARFYGEPSKYLKVIGVTGTNGKSSTTHYIAELLNAIGCPCAVIGTLGNGLPGKLETTLNTTPNPLKLQKLFAKFLRDGIQAVAMEVSSQGLANWRLNGTNFSCGVFTNLTRDHLDFHGTMERYGATKRSLFFDYPLTAAVINIDDPFGEELAVEFATRSNCKLYRYSLQPQLAHVELGIKRKQLLPTGFAVQLQGEVTSANLTVNLLGDFNLSNLLAALGAVHALGFKIDKQMQCAVAELHAVPGRMETFKMPDRQVLAVVDYAHTPDALQNVLKTLRLCCHGKLWVIFGCGGDRDHGKRPQMGEVAARYSDQIVLTSDNPRTENQQQIIYEIQKGIPADFPVQIEIERRKAIYYALQQAQPGDLILIAGKGHENYQIFGSQRVTYSDRAVIMEYLQCNKST